MNSFRRISTFLAATLSGFILLVVFAALHPDAAVGSSLHFIIPISMISGVCIGILFPALRKRQPLSQSSSGDHASLPLIDLQDSMDKNPVLKTLKASEIRYHALCDTMKSGVVIYRVENNGNDFIIEDFNKAAEQIENIPREQVLGKNVVDAFPGVEAFGLLDVFKAVHNDGISRTHPVTLYKDERISGWRDNYVYKLPSGEIVAIYTDETESHQKEEALRLSEARYRDLVEGTNDLISIIDPQGCIRFINHISENVFGLPPESCMGKSVFDMMPPEEKDQAKQEFELWKKEKRNQVTYENTLLNLVNGIRSRMHWKISLYYNDEGEFTHMNSIARDISMQKEMELKLKKAHNELELRVEERTNELLEINKKLEKEIHYRRESEHKLLFAKYLSEQANKAKNEFLANISHELRNPMHHILSYSRYGIEKIDTADKNKHLHYFTQIRKSADRLMILLNDLLDLSKMESGRMEYAFENHNIVEIAKDISLEFKPLLSEKDIKLDIETPDFDATLECDAYRIGQVMRNLFSNAVKYSQPFREITVTFEKRSLAADTGDENGLQVSFVDQGVGIPMDEMKYIFDKFTQSSVTKTGAGGTGLGLAICKEIIKVHHGRIWAENNPQGGTIFRFLLPFKQE